MNRCIKALTICCLLLPSACGLLPRGSGDYEVVIDTAYVDTPARYSAAGIAFIQALNEVGVTIAANSTTRIGVLDERIERRPVSTTASLEAAEYELRLEVDITISIDGAKHFDGATLAAERTYSVDGGNLSASQEEQELVQQELRESLAKMMVRMLESAATPGSAP